MKVSEIADYLKISRATVYRLLQQQNLPSHRVGSMRLFDQEEVDRWIRSHTNVPQTIAKTKGQGQRK